MTLCNIEFAHLRSQLGLSPEVLGNCLGVSHRTIRRYEKGESAPKRAVLQLLRSMHDARMGTGGANTFRFIDLFAGIGGLRRSFDMLGGRCVFTSEWNAFARKTYLANFHCQDDHVMAGDITVIKADQIPKHNVLLAGFPCQPFSIAGISKKNSLGTAHGFSCKAQGTLFFDVARIIAHHRPRAFLLENVKNLMSHDKGNTFRVIHDTLANELGYHVHVKVINAKAYLPQHRERIFIVGFRESNMFSFNDLHLPPTDSGPRLGTILHPEDGSEAGEEPYTQGAKAAVSDRYVLSEHLWAYLQQYAKKHREKGNGFGFGLAGPGDVARTLSARYYKDGSEILIRRTRDTPRRLTPRECARLMGFDKPGERSFVIPVSDTQAYKQFGNSVAVPVVEAVAKHMAPWILTGEARAPYVQKELALFV